MSQTDPRAVAAKLLGAIAVGPRDSAEFYIDLIAHALADAERRGMERAAGIAERYVLTKHVIGPLYNAGWNEAVKGVAGEIRAQAQADKDGWI